MQWKFNFFQKYRKLKLKLKKKHHEFCFGKKIYTLAFDLSIDVKRKLYIL